MSKPKVLIVGCGAVGMVQGYHLSAGAEITYLVRPGRRPAFMPPKQLYDYKADALRTFDNYRVIESVSEVAGEEFFCVLDTLDGYTAHSEGGAATLRAVGALIRDRPSTFVAYDAVGQDIENYYAQTMGISKDRFVLVLSMLAHQPTNQISTPAAADHKLISQADMLYADFPGNLGLMVFKRRPKLAKAFADMYNQNGVLKIQHIPGFLEDAMPMVAMLHVVAWNIDGYNEIEHLRANKDLWSTTIKAQKEILTLQRMGWTGWLLSWVLGSWMTVKILTAPVEGSKPLNYREFNAFHHGDKVMKQDVQVLKDLVKEGEREMKKMEALRNICWRIDEEIKKRT